MATDNDTVRLTVVYEATWGWGEIALARHEVVLDDSFDAEAQCEFARDEVLKATGIDPEDMEAGISLVKEVAPHHTAIRPDDYAANSGYGSDWIFREDFRLIHGGEVVDPTGHAALASGLTALRGDGE